MIEGGVPLHVIGLAVSIGDFVRGGGSITGIPDVLGSAVEVENGTGVRVCEDEFLVERFFEDVRAAHGNNEGVIQTSPIGSECRVV